MILDGHIHVLDLTEDRDGFLKKLGHAEINGGLVISLPPPAFPFVAPSSQYNRPSEFEPLLEINGLKFSLAHISWPWCDELIAVYGKFLNAYAGNPDHSVEMFIDITPGTPPIYRQEVLTKLL